MLALETRLPTPDGWTTVKDLQPGTVVFDELGYPVFVRAVGPVQMEKVHRVGFTNKRVERGAVLMTSEQRLCTWNRRRMKRMSEQTGIKTIPSDWAEYDGQRWTLAEIEDTYLKIENGVRNLQHVIPMTFPLILPNRDQLSVPPYIMGLVMQIHDRETGIMTCKEHMWDWYEKQFAMVGMPVTRTSKRLKRPVAEADVLFSSGTLNQALSGMDTYRNRGLIPPQYLRASVNQRMDLLAGLLDVPAPTDRGARAQVVCSDERVRDQALEVIRTLGYSGTPDVGLNANSYIARFSPVENPHRYPKFRAGLPDLTRLTRNTFQRFCWRVDSVALEAEVEVRAFDVTSPSGLVTVSDLFLPVVAN